MVRQTQDIDAALMRVYGVDQHGMDTEWRLALGLDPLPSPEELESRMQEPAESAAPEGETGSASGEETPVPAASSSESTEQQEPTAEPVAAESEDADTTTETESAQGAGDDEESAASSGCSAPPEGTASLGLGMLGLLAGPLGLGALPFLRRRPPPASSGRTVEN